jgi:hypothetical protein
MTINNLDWPIKALEMLSMTQKNLNGFEVQESLQYIEVVLIYPIGTLKCINDLKDSESSFNGISLENSIHSKSDRKYSY